LVVWFAVFTFLSGFANSFGELFFTRAMQDSDSAENGPVWSVLSPK